jgi:hypothetical protein
LKNECFQLIFHSLPLFRTITSKNPSRAAVRQG